VDHADRRQERGSRIRSSVKKRSLEIELIRSTFYLITAMGSVCVIKAWQNIEIDRLAYYKISCQIELDHL
jgi:hypothetical protein